MTSRRRVTMQPIGMPSRSLNWAIDLRALVITGLRPVIAAISLTADSRILAFWTASPSPMLTTTFSRRGTSMILP